jgi:hypothetical protein
VPRARVCKLLIHVSCHPKVFPQRSSATLSRPPLIPAPGPTLASLRLLSVGSLGRCTPRVTEVSRRGAYPAHDASPPGYPESLAPALRDPVSQPKLGFRAPLVIQNCFHCCVPVACPVVLSSSYSFYTQE